MDRPRHSLLSLERPDIISVPDGFVNRFFALRGGYFSSLALFSRRGLLFGLPLGTAGLHALLLLLCEALALGVVGVDLGGALVLGGWSEYLKAKKRWPK